jgi:hypothetical protein
MTINPVLNFLKQDNFFIFLQDAIDNKYSSTTSKKKEEKN